MSGFTRWGTLKVHHPADRAHSSGTNGLKEKERVSRLTLSLEKTLLTKTFGYLTLSNPMIIELKIT